MTSSAPVPLRPLWRSPFLWLSVALLAGIFGGWGYLWKRGFMTRSGMVVVSANAVAITAEGPSPIGRKMNYGNPGDAYGQVRGAAFTGVAFVNECPSWGSATPPYAYFRLRLPTGDVVLPLCLPPLLILTVQILRRRGSRRAFSAAAPFPLKDAAPSPEVQGL